MNGPCPACPMSSFTKSTTTRIKWSLSAFSTAHKIAEPTGPLLQLNQSPPRAPPPESSGAGCEEEKMDDALRTAKLGKLVEIEGYDSSEELLEAVFSDSVSP